MKPDQALRCVGALMAASLGSPASAAGLLGSTVTATIYYPDMATHGDSVTTTVGTGAEFGVGSVLAPSPYSTVPFSIDILNHKIIVSSFYSYRFPDGPFNAIMLGFNGASDITGFTGVCTRCVPGNLPGEGPSITANSFTVNVSGATVYYGDRDTYTFTFGAQTVPEPATWTIMLLGFGGIGAALRSRKAKMRASPRS